MRFKQDWFDDEQEDPEAPTGSGPQLVCLGLAVAGMVVMAVLLCLPFFREIAGSTTSAADDGVASGGARIRGRIISGGIVGAILSIPAAVAGAVTGMVLAGKLTVGLWKQVPFVWYGLVWSGGGGLVVTFVWWVFVR